MHYYQHHIGDFIKDTSFLTNEEVGIYLKLMWLYYDTEKPLPDDLFVLSMKTNARDADHLVLGLLQMYFTLVAGEWHHVRCDKAISAYHQQLDAASKAGKASADKRKLNDCSTTVQRALNDCSTTVQPTNNHKPITINHIIEPSAKKSTRLPPLWVATTEYLEFCKTERPDLNANEVAASFKDYWISVPGAKGNKLDWFATWRNWVRSQHKQVSKFAEPVLIKKQPAMHVAEPSKFTPEQMIANRGKMMDIIKKGLSK